MPVTCPNCGGAHPKWECREKPRREVMPDKRRSKQEPAKPQPDNALPPVAQPKKRAAGGTFDRLAYQREYMRKRRARKRGRLPKGDK